MATDEEKSVNLVIAEAMAEYQIQQPAKDRPKITIRQGAQMTDAILTTLEENGYVVVKKQEDANQPAGAVDPSPKSDA